MSRSPIPLEQVRVGEPCPADWEAMRGDERVRFCEGCRRHVHNLSAMTRDEAERLVCEAAGRLCVRFQPSPAGGVLTLDYQKARPHARRRFWGLLGVGGAVAAWASYAIAGRMRPAPPPPPMLMGVMVACPAPTPAPPVPEQLGDNSANAPDAPP